MNGVKGYSYEVIDIKLNTMNAGENVMPHSYSGSCLLLKKKSINKLKQKVSFEYTDFLKIVEAIFKPVSKV